MRRLVGVVTAVAMALGAAGVAVAVTRDDHGAAPVAASFTASTVSGASSCTTGDGYQIVNATYSGRASGDGVLSGPVRISLRASIDSAQQVGTLDGFLTVGQSQAHLFAAYRGGRVAGFLAGVSGGRRLVGTLTASYSPDGGFTTGTIGSGAVQGMAVRAGDGSCKPGDRHNGKGKR
jgi:hypothetical protein